MVRAININLGNGSVESVAATAIRGTAGVFAVTKLPDSEYFVATHVGTGMAGFRNRDKSRLVATVVLFWAMLSAEERDYMVNLTGTPRSLPKAIVEAANAVNRYVGRTSLTSQGFVPAVSVKSIRARAEAIASGSALKALLSR